MFQRYGVCARHGWDPDGLTEPQERAVVAALAWAKAARERKLPVEMIVATTGAF